MHIDLHARVLTRDGEPAGKVEHVVIDPQTNEVTDFVVSTGGFLGNDLLVPRAEIDQVSGEGEELRLRLDKHEFEQLPRYQPVDFGAPPPSWLPPLGYAFPSAGFLSPIPRLPADVPEAPAEPWQAPRTVLIDKGSEVIDRNGNHVGVVEDVQLESGSDCLEGFDIRLGGGLRTLLPGGDVVSVGMEVVDSVEPMSVRLCIDKDSLQGSRLAVRPRDAD